MTLRMSPRLRKYAKLLQTPACWPALRHGVAATLDHDITEAGFTLDGRFNTHVHHGEPVQADLLFRRAPAAAGAARP